MEKRQINAQTKKRDVMSGFNSYGALGVRQSELVTTAIKNAPSDEDSVNARLLIRAGYIRKLMAGTYSYLPLGQRVLTKIEAIIREEMGRIGSQEILMPALQPSEPWQQTGRWEKMDKILFKLNGRGIVRLRLVQPMRKSSLP
ncbi:MAG: hypothetical protein AB2740_02775 [Candidatus Thiodiazotropha sp.]